MRIQIGATFRALQFTVLFQRLIFSHQQVIKMISNRLIKHVGARIKVLNGRTTHQAHFRNKIVAFRAMSSTNSTLNLSGVYPPIATAFSGMIY